MKSARYPTLAGIGLILIIAINYGVSCDTGTVAPTPVGGGGPSVGDVTTTVPAPVGGQSGVETPESTGAGIFSASLSPSTTETEWCADLANGSDGDEWGTVACYEDQNRAIATQTLHDSNRVKLRSDETRKLCASKPCGNWQCDAVNLQGLPPKENPEFGANLLLGRIGRNNASSCKPPTTTTVPRCEPQGEGDGYNCEWDAKSCEWACQTCEEAFPASSGNIFELVTSDQIAYRFDVSHAGVWTLRLYAGSPGNPKRYLKRIDSERLSCGEDGSVGVSYTHRGHGSCLWTIEASGPGISVNKVVLNRCEQD